MWKTNNFDGQKTWYSEEEYKRIEDKLNKIQNLCLNLHEHLGKFVKIEYILDILEDKQ